MKKHRMLEAGEYTKKGDEFLHNDKSDWRDMEPDYLVTKHDEGYVRRPVPFTGKVAFLVTYSPMIRVVIDTTGLSEDEIDNKLVEASKAKYAYEYQQYMNDFGDNIDWERTKEDVEVPFEEEESKNPGKNALDYCNAQHDQGLGIAWIISDIGQGKLQVQRVDEPEHEGAELTPLESDETAWEIAKSLGWKLDENGYVLAHPGDEPKNPSKYRFLEMGEIVQDGDEMKDREAFHWQYCTACIGCEIIPNEPYQYRRPIAEPQYRPFMEGDVIEEGDQTMLNSGEWSDFAALAYGEVIIEQLVAKSRKLIK